MPHHQIPSTSYFVTATFFSERPFGISEEWPSELEVELLTRLTVAAFEGTANAVATLAV